VAINLLSLLPGFWRDYLPLSRRSEIKDEQPFRRGHHSDPKRQSVSAAALQTLVAQNDRLLHSRPGHDRLPQEERSESFAAEATVTLQAREEALEVRVNASADRQLESIKAVVASHLDRFAFREAPLPFDWR
jgi:uncharacterized caspase-like protein